jgi:hypothetical protein
MLHPRQLMRLLTEMLLLLLGALLVLLAATGLYSIPAGSPAWLALGAFLIYWGLRAWARRTEPGDTAGQRAVRSGSLVVIGVVMLVAAWMPFGHTRPLLLAAGAVLALRGILGAALAARAR